MITIWVKSFNLVKHLFIIYYFELKVKLFTINDYLRIPLFSISQLQFVLHAIFKLLARYLLFCSCIEQVFKI